PDPDDLLRKGLAAIGELVERAPELGADAFPAGRQPLVVVAVAGRAERGEELLQLGGCHLEVGGRLRAVPPRAALGSSFRFMSNGHRLVPPVSAACKKVPTRERPE